MPGKQRITSVRKLRQRQYIAEVEEQFYCFASRCFTFFLLFSCSVDPTSYLRFPNNCSAPCEFREAHKPGRRKAAGAHTQWASS